ncbi:MAG TPA: fluoride efflux transporter CrcB [Vicinamibacterales bacterium]
MIVLLVALGGALGALARHGLMLLAASLVPPSFPYGTFAVNVIGCFVFGLSVGLAEARGGMPPDVRAFLLVGVLGGFTTFSTYAHDSFLLIRNGAGLPALLNAAGQIVVGLVALWGGWTWMRA